MAELLNDDPAAYWQTDYLDRTQRLPQWVELELPEAREVCALLCGAWTGSTRGAILRAVLSASLDGARFEEVRRGEWREEDAGQDKLFAFPPRPVRFLRLVVDWAVMHTGDSNAVSISRPPGGAGWAVHPAGELRRPHRRGAARCGRVGGADRGNDLQTLTSVELSEKC